MSENPKEAGKVSRFFEEKGFYIILFLCVAAIGIAGYVLFFDPATTTDQDSALLSETDNLMEAESSSGGEILPPGNEVDLNDSVEIPTSGSEDALSDDTDALADDGSSAASAEPEEAIDGDAVIRDAVETIASQREEEPTEEAPVSQEPEETDAVPTFFVRPVSGEVLREFSGDELVYDRTMGDWRTHNGVDFLAEDGTLVSVVADGVIEDVYRDEYYGTGILVDHGGGLKSTYLGLIENATVSPGQTVTAGETIGAVSTTALFESLEQAHLHVEMTLDGVRVDPLAYLPE